MQIVIDIPKTDYEAYKEQVKMIEQEWVFYDSSDYALKKSIAKGIPLPKGHGRLIDADDLKRIGRYTHSNIDIDNAPTITEADKENEEMTYGDIYEEFCKKFPNAEVEDYRPAVEMYIPQIERGIPNAIIVWLKDGSEIIYIAESRNKR